MTQEITFQLLGGSYTGQSGLTFKKGDFLTSAEPLDAMFPNKFLRIANNSVSGVPSADRRPGRGDGTTSLAATATAVPEATTPAKAKAGATQAAVAGTPVAATPSLPPGNVVSTDVPMNATDVTSSFIATEVSAAHGILVWRLPSGGFAVTNLTDRKFLTEEPLKGRAEVQAFVTSYTGAGQ